MVKNRLTSLVVVALALGLSATSVFAQGQGGGRGRGGFGGGGFFQRDVLSLIANEAVVKELGVSEEVAAKLKKISDDNRADVRKAVGDTRLGQDATDAERAERRKKSEEAAKTARETYLPKVKETLTAEQYKRVQEIVYQANGLSDPEVVKALEITKEQQDKIAAINKEAGEKTRALFTGGAGGGEGAREKMQEINKERTTQVAAVLTADQTAKWNTMKGKEFDLAKLRPMGGPGGGRGNRGGAAGGTGGAAGRPATE